MATYYVATTGSNSNAGTISAPWLSWDYAFNRLVAGDNLYIRGGTYYAMRNTAYGVSVSGTARYGTASNFVNVRNYGSEVPVLDCDALSSTSGDRYGMWLNTRYWYIKGLTIYNVDENPSHSAPAKGWEMSACRYITLDQCNVHGCHQGFAFGGSTDNDYIYFINCDSYENGDHFQNGGLCNGFNINTPQGSHIFFDGCRAWSNSDDGFDAYGGSGYITFNRCWAFENGNWDGETGDGAGFKTGQIGATSSGVVRLLTNCLSFDNLGIGFDESRDNANSVIHNLFNNVSYNNGDRGFNYGYAGVTDVIRNNIGYSNGTSDGFGTNNTVDHNSWQVGDAVASGDFITLNSAGMKGERGSDGSLPVTDFLKLATGSHLIHAGVDVGLDTDGAGNSYNNPTPSIGAYEAGEGSGRLHLIIEGETFVNTETGIWNGENIPRTLPTDFIFRNNSITSVNYNNYMLQAGDESPLATNNNLDGEIITGNLLDWNGSDDTGGCHGIFVGYNINAVIKYNYLDHVPYGVVFKSGDDDDGNMTYTSGGFAYNIVRNSYIAVRIKGINGICVYNNTFYDDVHTYVPAIIYIDENPDNGGDGSTGTKIKNNIFYTTNSIKCISVDTTSLIGFECDYNLYYCNGGNPKFEIEGVEHTWEQWQAHGYDTNSIVIDPGFTSTTTLNTSGRLDYGTDLGSIWIDGLSVNAVWGINSPLLAQQNGTWQVGARIGTISVGTITVTGTGGATTISSDNGTLQMIATFNPVNAVNQEVTWSVTNGTGSATINSDGLLSAVNNGTVTVRATANDGSGIYGTRLITISGQVSTILVTLITVTGTGGATTITISGGSLQMLAHVDPHNATDKTYTWSITNGTSLASISESGLVTAARNGTIVVRAMANDGSGIYGTRTITITNQEIIPPIVYVPDGDAFCLSVVCEVVQPSSNTLVECYAHADPALFDPAYHINDTWLSEFRNYGHIGGLKDYDGNVYTTITIGSQEWIIENLRVTHYADGSDITLITSDATWAADTTGAMCWYNNDKATYEIPYGALYNWYAVTNASILPYFTRNGIQEIGWRIPNYFDLLQLVTYLGGNSVAGGKLKESGTTHWDSPNTGADNSSGFTALPAGVRGGAGAFSILLSQTWIVSKTIQIDGFVEFILLVNDSANTSITNTYKYYGMSVRCLRGTYVVTAPVATAATNILDDGFDANWEIVIGVMGYYLDVSTDINFGSFVAGYNNLDIGNVLTYTVTGLDADTTYYYRIRAYDDSQTSVDSNTITITTETGVVPYTGYGCLYNWYAVDTGKLAPTGWHVPSYTEWEALLLELDPDGTGISNDAGAQLKEEGTVHWNSPNVANNITGFNAVGAGIRLSNGAFIYRNDQLYLMNIDDLGGFTPASYLIFDDATFYTLFDGSGAGADRTMGQSIVCFKDDPSGWTEGDTVTDIDGNIYPTCKIGNQVLMAENLRVTRFNDDTPITNVTDNTAWAALTTEAYCWYNNTPD